MKKLVTIGFIICLTISILPSTNHSYAEACEDCISKAQLNFQNEFRRLWIDHVLWTSNYITSATTAGAEDQQQVLNRLLKNQVDIGNAIKPIYGEDAGNKLTDLLTEHIVIAGKIVDAAINGDEKVVEEQNKEWFRNADDIVAFLSQANPHLKEKDLKELLYMHLDLVTEDLQASLDKEWDERIVSIDEGMSHIIIMANAISEAVVKEFPEKF